MKFRLKALLTLALAVGLAVSGFFEDTCKGIRPCKGT